MKLSELQAKRKANMDKMQALLDARESASREFTSDEATSFDALEAETTTLNADIIREEKAIAFAKNRAIDKATKTAPEVRAAKAFSWHRAINSILGHKQLDGVEGEMTQETQRELNAVGASMSGNVGVPSFMVGFQGKTINGVKNANVLGKAQVRDLTAAGSTTGDELVEDLHIGHVYGLNIAPKVISQMGATVLPGLSSDVHLTKTGVATSVWATENASSTETTPSTARITLTPKRLTGYTEISKTLLTQVPGFVNAWIARELETSTNVALDAAAINGSGAAGQPTGILNFGSGVNSVALGTNGDNAGRDNLISMETLIAEDNADMDMMAFLTTPGVRGYFKNLKTDAGSGTFVWGNDNQLIGYNAYASNNVPATLTKGTSTDCHAIILGVWNQLLIAQFGGLDLLVDPFSLSLTNMIRMVINTNWDINTRHLQAFCYIKDARV